MCPHHQVLIPGGGGGSHTASQRLGCHAQSKGPPDVHISGKLQVKTRRMRRVRQTVCELRCARGWTKSKGWSGGGTEGRPSAGNVRGKMPGTHVLAGTRVRRSAGPELSSQVAENAPLSSQSRPQRPRAAGVPRVRSRPSSRCAGGRRSSWRGSTPRQLLAGSGSPPRRSESGREGRKEEVRRPAGREAGDPNA
jgi:hypothetical protein